MRELQPPTGRGLRVLRSRPALPLRHRRTTVRHVRPAGTATAAMRTELAEVRRKLGPPGAVERAADALYALLTTPSGNDS